MKTMKSKERKQVTNQLTDYIEFLQNKYSELLEQINELDLANESQYHYDLDNIILDFDMLTACCDEDVDDKYQYALCENLIRTYRSALYCIAIERYNDYCNNK